MKKVIYFILLVFFFAGCEKDYNQVVNTSNPETVQVKRLSNHTLFTYNPSDSAATVTIEFDNVDALESVRGIVYAPNKEIVKNSEMFDNGNLQGSGDNTAGDKVYSMKLPLNTNMLSGKYNIEYYVKAKGIDEQKTAINSFEFNNGTGNFAPVLSNSMIEPDTITVTDTVQINLQITAQDQNGLNDIVNVILTVNRPNGSIFTLQLYDDGDSFHGDQTAGDGIYSLIIQVNQNNTKGLYRFDFQAKDRGNKLSNIISHNVLIQ